MGRFFHESERFFAPSIPHFLPSPAEATSRDRRAWTFGFDWIWNFAEREVKEEDVLSCRGGGRG